MDMESRFTELKRYVRFDDADAALLGQLRPLVESHFERLATEFYERIREHEEAHDVLTGEAQLARLHRSFVQWLERLLAGPYDETYYLRTYGIGQAHVRVGLPQRYMFVAVALVRSSLTKLADEALGPRAQPTRDALGRLLDVELAVMLEGYRENLERRAERRHDLETREHADTLTTASRWEAAIEASPLLVVGIDGGGAIRLFNREATATTGLTMEEAIGASFVETMVAPDLRSRDREVLEELLEEEPRALVLESLLRTRAGRERDVRWTFVRLPAERGGVELFAFGQDVTDARAKSERAHRKDKLAAMGALTAGLAHEIRNPLNGAQLHLAILERAARKAGSHSEVLEAASVVGAEIARLAQLLSEFLELARAQPLERNPTDLRDLVRRADATLDDRAAAAGVIRHLDLPSQPLVSNVDAARLEGVISGMLHNAIDALTPHGGGRVTVRARRQPRQIVLEIEDDGPGIPAGAPVFDPFFSTKPGGTGLGLAIAHRIITDHEGTITLESRRGHTCFRFTLPTQVGTDAPDTWEG
ncbi:MAG: PAS domain S-box protein [Deltaproteobacteria bacterium]|nr:PAS domain S-box protein [Deltaproteobacteria bacterium]